MDRYHQEASPNEASLNILSLPDEILLDIFHAVKERQGPYRPNRSVYHHHRFLPPAAAANNLHSRHARGNSSNNDIANIRLTCSRFAATSSHLLLPTVHVKDISSPSLAKLEAIAHHPLIGKGVQKVKLSTCFYTSSLASQEIHHFAWYAVNRVFDAAARCQEGIQAERQRAEEAGSGSISEALLKKWMSEIAALEDVMRVLKSWRQLTRSAGDGGEEEERSLFPQVVGTDGSTTSAPTIGDESEKGRHIMLLRIAHAHYRSRYQDQEMLLADGKFVKRFSQAMARMPRAKVLEVVDSNHEERDCSTCRLPRQEEGNALLWGESEEVDLYDRLLDIDTFIRPFSWEEAIAHQWSAVPPVELLFKLPVGLQLAGVSLDRIAYSTIVPTEQYYPLLSTANEEDFSHLGSAVKALGIKSFAFLQGDELRPVARASLASKDVQAFKRFITAMSSSGLLERLRVRLGGGWADGSLDPDHHHNLGGLLWPAPAPPAAETTSALTADAPRAHEQTSWGQNLRDISITGVPFAFSDLDNFARHLRNAGAKLDFLSLSRVCLTSGSWKHALDLLRDIDVHYDKELFAPVGAECDEVTMQLTDQYDKIFCAEPGSGSAAECYINGEIKQNPLKSGWAVDFVYSIDGDMVVVSVVSSEEESGNEDEDDEEEEEEEGGEGETDHEEYYDDDDDEDTEVGEEEEEGEEEKAISKAKALEDSVVIVADVSTLDEVPSVEHVEYATAVGGA